MSVECGFNTWEKGKLMVANQLQPVAASDAWTSHDTVTARLCFYHTPFIQTLRVEFAEDQVRLNTEANAGFGTTQESEIIGTLAAVR